MKNTASNFTNDYVSSHAFFIQRNDSRVAGVTFLSYLKSYQKWNIHFGGTETIYDSGQNTWGKR